MKFVLFFAIVVELALSQPFGFVPPIGAPEFEEPLPAPMQFSLHLPDAPHKSPDAFHKAPELPPVFRSFSLSRFHKKVFAGLRGVRACADDRAKFCDQAQEGFIVMVACLVAARDQLSSECRQVVDAFPLATCAPLVVKFCPDAHGPHKVKKCLLKHKEDLPAECVEALQKHRGGHRRHHMPPPPPEDAEEGEGMLPPPPEFFPPPPDFFPAPPAEDAVDEDGGMMPPPPPLDDEADDAIAEMPADPPRRHGKFGDHHDSEGGKHGEKKHHNKRMRTVIIIVSCVGGVLVLAAAAFFAVRWYRNRRSALSAANPAGYVPAPSSPAAIDDARAPMLPAGATQV